MRFQKPAVGTWTEHYRELGTKPVSIAPPFYELEREAIFKRAWLNLGRMEQPSRNGSYFTKDLPGVRTSRIASRMVDGRPPLRQHLAAPRSQAAVGRHVSWTS